MSGYEMSVSYDWIASEGPMSITNTPLQSEARNTPNKKRANKRNIPFIPGRK